jgi:hypothetical protein
MTPAYGETLARSVAARIHAPVALLTDLDGIPADERIDGMVANVTADQSQWQWVDASTASASGIVRIPTDAPSTGRWIRTPANGIPLQVDEWTNPAAASATALLAATASTVAVQTYLTAALSAGGKTALAAYPRNVTFTTAGVTPSDAPATAVITGTDIDGNALTETVTIAQTATIAQGVKCFKTITSIVYAAGDGTGATVSIGIGQKFGFSKLSKTRAGGVAVLAEIAVGVTVTNGTFATAATSPPYGSYSPNTAPDGANDYAVTYELG